MRRNVLIALLLVLVLTVGVVVLSAQSNYDGPQWEYLFVDKESLNAFRMESIRLNGQDAPFEGNTYTAFDALGAMGWEYAGEPYGNAFLFKRPLN